MISNFKLKAQFGALLFLLLGLVRVQGQACTPAPPGMISWWPAAGNGNDIVGTNHGSLANGLVCSPGEVGLGFNFDGADDRFVVPDSASLNFGAGADFSVEAWIQALPNSTDFDVLSIADKRVAPNISQCIGYELSLVGGVLCSRISDSIGDNGSHYSSTGPDLRDGVFHHVAMAVERASSTGGTFYVDGVAVSTFDPTSEPGSLANSGPFILGQNAVSSIHTAFKGNIDEVAIYNRALLASEVQAIYDAGTAGKCPQPPTIVSQPTNQTVFVGGTTSFTVVAGGGKPLGYQWSFAGSLIPGATNATLLLTNIQTAAAGNYSVLVTNACCGTNSADAVLTVNPAPPCIAVPAGLVSWWQAEGNGTDSAGLNHGTLVNGLSYGPGRRGQGFNFDGADDLFTVPDSASLNFGPGADFSIEAWITAFPNSTDFDVMVIVDKRITPNIAQCLGYTMVLVGGQLAVRFSDSLSHNGSAYTATSADLRDGAFHHVALTVTRNSASGVRFYVDGVLVGSFDATTESGDLSNSSALLVGENTAPINTPYKGIIDELAIYSRALSASEIQDIFNGSAGGKCDLPPRIVTQPSNQTAMVNTSVLFSVQAGGTPPLSYQWRLYATNLPGATGSSLILSNVQPEQAGLYSVAVSNSVGFALSSNAQLTTVLPPAAVRIGNTNATAGGSVTVPVTMVANGNENSFGFSLNFDPSRLTYTGTTLGTGATSAGLSVNNSQIASGKLGLGLNLPPNATFNPGTQTIAQVSFAVAVDSQATNTTLSFSDQPVLRQLLDNQLNTLSANYFSGTVTIAIPAAYEGDVFPRPNGDRNASLADWLLLGRYAARLDYPTNAAEFQRADSAPRSTAGDGQIKVTDWVQAGRYVFGLDPMTPIGGPSVEVANSAPAASGVRLLTVGTASLNQDQTGQVSINLASQGDENALGFSLLFNPTMASYVGASPGGDAGGATLFVNTNQIASGKLGIVLALGAGNSFIAGTREVVRVSLQGTPFTLGSFSLSCADLPVPREASDFNARALPISFLNGTVNVSYQPTLRIDRSGQNMLLAWPVWATNFNLQEAGKLTSLSTSWTNLLATPNIVNNENVLTLPRVNTNRFYRLYHP